MGGTNASILDLASGSKLILPSAVIGDGSQNAVFGDNTGAITVKTAGTVTVHVDSNYFTPGQKIVLVDSSAAVSGGSNT
uniref:Uncharacterized protein n=1 Tax=Candidatus Kentrum sp. TC TaxID=2126339 RepID=A0A450ZXW1_9GAMM|nr:MAG: hypothetical protein BECKTC1821F_GA0114240_102520 [Candidatus Kentron sp. TC]